MSTATRNLPVETYRINGVSVSIFENQPTGENRGTFYRSRVDKRYRDQSGQWKSTTSFSLDELLRLKLLIDRAINFMVDKTNNETHQQQ